MSTCWKDLEVNFLIPLVSSGLELPVWQRTLCEKLTLVTGIDCL
jgi:hypothetical protein